MKEARDHSMQFLLRTLLSERPEYSAIQIPHNMEEQRLLMRSLMNVRPPLPATADFLAAQNYELQMQAKEKGIVALEEIEPCNSDGRLRLWQGDITRLQVDAIVNAANSALLGCFVPLHKCIDNAIHSAAGVELRLECNSLMQKQGHSEPTGKAKMTKGYNLPASYVIHTVGPIISEGIPTRQQEKQLADCYRSCLDTAGAHKLESLAFCCISTGEFGFPQQQAAEIAVATVLNYLDNAKYTTIKTIVFDVFSRNDYAIYRELLQ